MRNRNNRSRADELFGEAHHRARWNFGTVESVRAMREHRFSYTEIGVIFGMAKSTVRDIVLYRIRCMG